MEEGGNLSATLSCSWGDQLLHREAWKEMFNFCSFQQGLSKGPG